MEDVPTLHQLPTETALALLLETAREQFRVLQFIILGEIKLVSDQQNDLTKRLLFARAPGCVGMALAKSFVANVVRARRICEHGGQSLTLDKMERKLFLSQTNALLQVRDVNEHGLDVKGNEIDTCIPCPSRWFYRRDLSRRKQFGKDIDGTT